MVVSSNLTRPFSINGVSYNPVLRRTVNPKDSGSNPDMPVCVGSSVQWNARLKSGMSQERSLTGAPMKILRDKWETPYAVQPETPEEAIVAMKAVEILRSYRQPDANKYRAETNPNNGLVSKWLKDAACKADL